MKTIIRTSNAPKPVGPYNQAVVANGMVYLSGQIAIDPTTGNLVLDSIETETHQVMRNLQAVLAAAGTTFEAVVKTTIFLTDMENFKSVNAIYGSYFKDQSNTPARATVAVKTLPLNVNVEISMIAVLSK